MLSTIRSWFRNPKAPPAPWSYISHEYAGLAQGCHVYMASATNGTDAETLVFRFHAHAAGRPSEAKMAKHLAAMIAKRNGG